MQTAAWMSSKGVGLKKGCAELGVPSIQFPASCLTESFKTGAFLQEMESLRAANLQLYESSFVPRGTGDTLLRFHLKGTPTANEGMRFSGGSSLCKYHPLWTEKHGQDRHFSVAKVGFWSFSLPPTPGPAPLPRGGRSRGSRSGLRPPEGAQALWKSGGARFPPAERGGKQP